MYGGGGSARVRAGVGGARGREKNDFCKKSLLFQKADHPHLFLKGTEIQIKKGTVVLLARANVFFGGGSFLPPPYFINY